MTTRLTIPLLVTVAALAATAAALLFAPALAGAGVAVALGSSVWAAANIRSQVTGPLETLAAHLAGDADADVQSLVSRPDVIGQATVAMLTQSAALGAASADADEARQSLAATIADLSRRNLTLVTRLLDAIEQTQKGAADPALLKRLYAIDHLGVQLRRQSEDLLVLADEPPVGGPDDPAILPVDLIRIAASETEGFDRVIVESTTDLPVVGWAIRPMGQMLAALIDNASRYPPPGAPVTVTAQNRPGGITISVADLGIGMTATALATANATIADRPLLQAAQTHQLGLFVVGRIAARLGCTVTLAANDPSGITAAILVPATLLDGAVAPAEVPSPTTDTPSEAPAPLMAAVPSGPAPDVSSLDFALAALELDRPVAASAAPTPAGPTGPDSDDEPTDKKPSWLRRTPRLRRQPAQWTIRLDNPNPYDNVGDTNGAAPSGFVNDTLAQPQPEPAAPQPTASKPAAPDPDEAASWLRPAVPDDYVPDVVANPLIDVLPDHPGQPITADSRSLSLVTDDIVMDGIAPAAAAAPPTLPARTSQATDYSRPMTALFADIANDPEAADDVGVFAAATDE
jgi:signal transduction histidine kinase